MSIGSASAHQVPLKPAGRFNDWGERRWIEAEPDWIRFVDREIDHLGLAPRARCLCRSAMHTYSEGIEFVFLTNAQFSDVVTVEGGVWLVPCFTPMNLAKGISGDDRQIGMSRRGYFVYDGWLANREWTKVRLERAVSVLDDLVHLFSLSGRWFAYWEPKYRFDKPPVEFYQPTPEDIRSLTKTIDTVNLLSPSDRAALRRSAAWMANALRAVSPVQRFLLLFISIESLATYIERGTDIDSPLLGFAGAKLSKTDRRRMREACIRDLLSLKLDAEPTHAVSEAYFDCVVGVRRTLEDHLTRVFGNRTVSKVIFEDAVEGKTLWQLRNDIAHGSLNILSEAQLLFVTGQVSRLERIARSYLRQVLAGLAGGQSFTPV